MSELVEELKNKANIIAENGQLEQLVIDGVLNQPPTLHPNGFIIFKVGKAGAWTVRIHVWPNTTNDRKLIDPYHNHAADAFSLVLQGSLLEKRWAFKEREGGPFYKYNVCYSGTASTLEFSGSAGLLELASEKTYGAGTLYLIEKETIHSVLCKESPCVTVFLLKHSSNEGANVYSSERSERPTQTERNHLTHPSIISARKIALNALALAFKQ